MTRTGQQYPNSKVRPHQHWASKLPELDATWGMVGATPQHPNRAQRRDYVRAGARNVRRSIVGFGRWRRHNPRDDESHALLTAEPVQQAPRWERRLYDVTRAKAARRLRRKSREVE